jgi:hypothetical protein
VPKAESSCPSTKKPATPICMVLLVLCNQKTPSIDCEMETERGTLQEATIFVEFHWLFTLLFTVQNPFKVKV